MTRVDCDVCGKPDGRRLTEGERAMWPSIAPWIKAACGECRGRFQRNAERFEKREAAAA